MDDDAELAAIRRSNEDGDYAYMGELGVEDYRKGQADIDTLLRRLDAAAQREAALRSGIDTLLGEFENEHEDHNENDLNNFYTDMSRKYVIDQLRALLGDADSAARGE